MKQQSEVTIQSDVVIIGGGISGLWAMRVLKNLGYKVILLEKYALGEKQTIRSQGILHSGIKYSLGGKLTEDAKAVADAIKIWEDCLEGKGEIDLRKVEFLSEYQYLWTTGNIQ